MMLSRTIYLRIGFTILVAVYDFHVVRDVLLVV